MIDNRRTLLFGPFAGFSPKFLKTGSNLDLLSSIQPSNLVTMLAAGVKNVSLIKYLIQQLSLSKDQRMKELRTFVPSARNEDWDLVAAGQRVQVIKDTAAGGKGTIEFGSTEIASTADRSLAALLGGSPGASTAVSAMLELIEICFPHQIEAWEPKLKEMIPSYGESMINKPEQISEIQAVTAQALGLNESGYL